MPKPKLTPEERKQLRLQKKAEKKRRAALKKRQLKTDHLDREIEYGNLTLKRYGKKWRQMMIKIALPHMREDLQYAWHNFERLVDSKDFVISLLLDDVGDAQEQYMMNLRNHCENIDQLIRSFEQKAEELRKEILIRIEERRREAEAEANDLNECFIDGENYLKTMLYGLERARKNQKKKVRGVLLSRIDEEDTKYQDIIQRMRADVEVKLVHVWDQTDIFLDEYYSKTHYRKMIYEEMNERDAAFQQMLQKQMNKINNSNELIKAYRQRYTNVVKINGNTLEDLDAERKFFSDSFNIMKSNLEIDNGTDRRKLLLLTSKSREAINYLEDCKKKGKRILTLGAVCRKMETEMEKILPFPMPPTLKQMGKSSISMPTLESDQDTLNLFSGKVGQANALRYALNEEREYLIKENKKLKHKIHDFCECLDCPALPPIAIKKSFHVTDTNAFMRKYMQY